MRTNESGIDENNFSLNRSGIDEKNLTEIEAGVITVTMKIIEVIEYVYFHSQ